MAINWHTFPRISISSNVSFNRGGKMIDEYVIENISFGDLSKQEVANIFSDGRIASHFLERQLEIWYPFLKFVNKRGYDHINVNDPNDRYDQKCFTEGGLGFAPSSMVGAGRKINEDVAYNHCKDITYICCDIVDFPRVRVKFVPGAALLKLYPKFKIPYRDRNILFSR